jgi:hypothetical protein
MNLRRYRALFWISLAVVLLGLAAMLSVWIGRL